MFPSNNDIHIYTHALLSQQWDENAVRAHTHAHKERRGGSDFFWWRPESEWIDYIPSKCVISVPESKTQTVKSHTSYVFTRVWVCVWVCMDRCLCLISSFKKQLKFVKPGLKHFCFVRPFAVTIREEVEREAEWKVRTNQDTRTILYWLKKDNADTYIFTYWSHISSGG